MNMHSQNSGRQIPKQKTKTRPEDASSSAKVRAGYAAAFAKLDDEVDDFSGKPPSVLYILKETSVAHQVISLIFPVMFSSRGNKEGGKTVGWLDFVSAMRTLNLKAEDRGGSAFTYRGEIILPTFHSNPQKRSISIYRHHPSTQIGPVLLHSLGRQCNRRFGW